MIAVISPLHQRKVNDMTVYDVVVKLIGNVRPVGETYEDDRRFENLKEMTILVDNLLSDIDCVIPYKSKKEYSMKRAGEFADNFFTKLGIIE